MKITSLFLAGALLLAGCHQYEKTRSGLVYKITPGGSKETLKQGQFVKLNLEFSVKLKNGKDSVLETSYGHIDAAGNFHPGALPTYMIIDTARLGKHNFTEVITQCAPGDKLDFVMSVDTMKKLSMISDYNDVFTKGSMITGKANIIRTFATEQQTNADIQKEIELEKQREDADIQKYLKAKNIKAEKSPEGVYVMVQNPGDTAKAADGKQVSAFYIGSLMDGGRVFDADMGPSATHKDAFTFVLGSRGAIPGMEAGLKYFGKGGRGTIYIPAMLAYGNQGQPPVIPKYANLVFEVQMADVSTPLPIPKMPAPGAPVPPVKK